MASTTLKLNDPAQARKYFEEKLEFTTGPMEVSQQLDDNADILVVDVRAEKDYKEGHVPGSINLPKERWSSLQGLQNEKLNILVCYSQTCHLAARAAVEFAAQGFSVMEMDGGFKGWKEQNLKIEK